MTQKEFEERTELKLTADNYTEVETIRQAHERNV